VQQVRKKLRINIPAGVDSGTRLRVNSEGNAGQRGGPSGDLYVVLFVQADPKLRRDGINIHSELTVSYLQAILGDKLQVETVDGPEEFQIPAGTQPGTVLTLKDRGVPRLGNPVARGNHLFSVKVVLPQKLDANERELLEQLATIAASHPKGKGGLFGGLFQ
jgi:molecular chaperone DnaJ